MDDDELYDTIHSAVRDALAEQPKKGQKNQVTEAAFLFCAIWFGILMIDYVSYAPWLNRFRYSFWYNVDDSQVIQTQKKPPSDCDFFRAPIGGKGCHYEKQVEVQEPSAANGGKRSVFVYWSKEDEDK